MTEALNALAANIVSRHKAAVDPYVLFLGAGASIGSGCLTTLGLADELLKSHDAPQLSALEAAISTAHKIDATFGDLKRLQVNDEKIARFFDIWATLDSETKFAFLRKHLSDGKIPSRGYLELAHLVRSGFFTTILTTNLDTLLEKSLTAVGLIQPENFIVIVNGKDSLSELNDQLESSRVPIKVIKLHGSLESPRSYAFTPDEIFSFEKTIRSSLSRILNQSLIVVGHSMQDRDINTLFEDEGREIHYVNPSVPKRGSAIDNILTVRGLGSTIAGSDGGFDSFFGQLRTTVESFSIERLADNSGHSIEVFLQSIGFEAELKAPRSRYKNLQTLYVKPTEYDDILRKLERDHVVFIIGEPHMGKTYSALYLLWEYYQKGYEAIHLRHDQLRHLLHRHNNNLKELLLELFTPKDQHPRIVHFDDPFGETSERRTEAFANELDTFIEMAKSYEHLRVLVTSRLNIFNEAIAGQLLESGVQELEKTLRVHTSYKHEVLLDILHRYVNFYKPAWAQEERIVAELDEKLPAMLPAPHNIEFFVRTSETLSSLDAVLSHVEESKKMISALAAWMKGMAPHEQIFLMWVEICSAASILFPGVEASEVDIERAFKDTLAFLFSEGYLPGIPTMPFAIARDKFETILIERRNDSANEMLRLDFVHPSYHEAFWYAVNCKFPIVQWWELLSTNVDSILGKLSKGIDLVQLKMIERYGTINRDLDQLLLLSAVSDDPHEQLIALDHMLNRPERFENLPELAACVSSLLSSPKESVLNAFLLILDKKFEELPSEVLRLSLPLLFHKSMDVRKNSDRIIGDRRSIFPESLRDDQVLRKFDALVKLSPSRSTNNSRVDSLIFMEIGTPDFRRLTTKILTLSPSEIHQLAQISTDLVSFYSLFEGIVYKFSTDQKRAIVLDRGLVKNKELRSRIERIIVKYPDDLTDRFDEYPVIRDIANIQQAFGFSKKRDFEAALKDLSVRNWPDFSPSDLRELCAIESLNLGFLIVSKILEENEKLPPDKRIHYLTALHSPTTLPALVQYIDEHAFSSSIASRWYPKLSEEVLRELLNGDGQVRYEVLTSLLLRFDKLSEVGRTVVTDLTHNPPGAWVGASIGQLCHSRYSTLLTNSIVDLPWQIRDLNKKAVTGALLAEMTQCYVDSAIGIQEIYEPLLRELIKDTEHIHYAEKWIDYSLTVLNFYDPGYWAFIKKELHRLNMT